MRTVSTLGVVAVFVALGLVFSGCVTTGERLPCHGDGPCPMHVDAEKGDSIYTCECGPQCACKTVSKTPGTCSCGRALVPGHVVKVEGTEALVCRCGADCTCKLDPNDPGTCGCGKAVKRVDLQGAGLYFCNCGGSCFCNTVSDKPGRCKCGMELKKAD